MLVLQKLTAGYGKTMILHDVSISVGKGESVAIIGRNGVGKTTLMKSVMGLLKAQSGSVTLNGQEITQLPAYERAHRGMGYVPQGRGIFPLLTVTENLAMGALINAKVTDKSQEVVFEYFPPLKERRHQKAGTMSGGEQSMLAIGRALVGRPELLVLDEPSEGIQPNIVQQIGEIIRRINRDLGLTVVFVEQNIELVRQLADRCYVMDKGSIVKSLDGDALSDQAAVTKYLAV